VNPEDAHFFNRDLSWLDFNLRVLGEAEDARNPLLERARFLAIVTTNLDEFAMVRLAELRRNRGDRRPGLAGLSPEEQFARVRGGILAQIERQYACWRDALAPALAEHGFALAGAETWTAAEREEVRACYRQHLEPILTPLAVDPTRPFPLIANLAIHIAVALRAEGSEEIEHALVAVPTGIRHFVLDDGRHALAEELVANHLDTLFPGHEILARCAFRIVRDGTIEIDEDQATDLLSEMEEGLLARAHGRPLRLEHQAGADADLLGWLRESLEVDEDDTHPLDGPLDLGFLFRLDAHVPGPELVYPPFAPRPPPRDWSDPFATVRERDVLLHHPYESFDPVVELIEHAARDERVLAIKQTLYRLSGNSPVMRSLIHAARAGKQVTVMLELKARFDEEANIRWARRLEEVGAHVIYGLVGLKVHAKLLLIVRRDDDGLRRYCHLGTGNYNERTARVYTDLSLMTADDAVGKDVAALFNMITGFARPPAFSRLAVAPHDLRRAFVDAIRREADHARAGRNAGIFAKFNSLVDPDICEELYTASRAGVTIELVVRGMCILRPGVPGLSERIRVRSIVGRFLEHSRIYRFENDGEPHWALSSADLMTRNLDRRVEHLVWIEDKAVRTRLEGMRRIYLEDRRRVRFLGPDGTYARPDDFADGPSCQDRFLVGEDLPEE